MGEEGVSVDMPVHAGEMDRLGDAERLRVDRGAADREDGPRFPGKRLDGRNPIREAFRAGHVDLRERPRQDDVPPPLERAELRREGEPGSASHEDDASGGDLGEVPEIFREVPGDSAIRADDSVAGYGGDDFDARVHTATSILMGG